MRISVKPNSTKTVGVFFFPGRTADAIGVVGQAEGEFVFWGGGFVSELRPGRVLYDTLRHVIRGEASNATESFKVVVIQRY